MSVRAAVVPVLIIALLSLPSSLQAAGAEATLRQVQQWVLQDGKEKIVPGVVAKPLKLTDGSDYVTRVEAFRETDTGLIHMIYSGPAIGGPLILATRSPDHAHVMIWSVDVNGTPIAAVEEQDGGLSVPNDPHLDQLRAELKYWPETYTECAKGTLACAKSTPNR